MAVGSKLLPDCFRRYRADLKHDFLRRDGEEFWPVNIDIPAQFVAEPCFYLDGEHIDHYGHLTLEVLSRLWCFREVNLTSFRILTSHKDPSLIALLLRPLGVNEEQVLQFKQSVFCKTLIISSQSYVLETRASRSAFDVYRTISQYYDSGTYRDRIYVSRSRWKTQRNLVNELEVEDCFRRKGFLVVHPETMAVSDQIALFGSASVIAGTSGSGMYNTIYGSKKKLVIILVSERFITLNDALINSGSNGDIQYLSGSALEPEKPGMVSDWIIDVDTVRQYLELKF